MNQQYQKLKLIILIVSAFCCQSQAQFFLNGTAMETNDSCYQLTADVDWQVGSIWHGDKVNLNESFEVAVDLFLGCKDNDGADGIVFGLQPLSTSIGIAGGDLGIGGVSPSIAVEFDTYQNGNFGDPAFDHIAVIRNGNVNHMDALHTLAGPVQANANSPNIEDCAYHALQIVWDAVSQNLSIYFDCELRLSYTANIVSDIFAGDPEVFWGFTSSTGGSNNIQEVCFSYTSILDAMEDQSICAGGTAQLEANGGVSYQWSPATGLSDTNIANPIASPTETTLYTVEIVDDCGIIFYDDVLVTIEEAAFDLSIISTPANLTEVSPGEEFNLFANVIPPVGNYSYSWSSTNGSIFESPNSAKTLATSPNNQTGTDSITVLVTAQSGCTKEASIYLEMTGFDYDIPSAFSPNGDMINDGFGIITQSALDTYHCKIFSRWGQLVFETNNPSEYWDGTFKGKAMPSDVYVYLITFEVAGEFFDKKGDLTLLR